MKISKSIGDKFPYMHLSVGNGELQKFIEKQFGSTQTIRDEVISSYYDGESLVFETKSGKIIKR